MNPPDLNAAILMLDRIRSLKEDCEDGIITAMEFLNRLETILN